MWPLKIISLVLILLMTILAGSYPFIKRLKTQHAHDFLSGESLAAGIFLGAGLMHMLGDASEAFYHMHYNYPFAFALAGITFLLLLWLEHLGREIYHKKGGNSSAFAIIATIMLSLHSFLLGTALGLSDSLSVALVILLAILAHKGAASFALAVQINKSPLSFKAGISLFIFFAIMVPLGIVCGASATHMLSGYPLLVPIFSSLASGTLLYLGTLHGLEQAILVKECCDLRRFSFVVIGFVIMAIVAIWT